MRALVVVHPVPKDIKKVIDIRADDYIIGVDQAVLALYKQRIKIDLAVGDFDSLKNPHMLTQLNTVRLKPEKDMTDSYQALVEAKKKGVDEIIMIGGFGGNRIEHFIAHLILFDTFDNLIMINEYSKIYLISEGSYPMSFEGYVSLFAYPNAEITLKGFKYPLNHYELKTYDPLCISNQIKKDAQIDVHQGKVLVILSKQD